MKKRSIRQGYKPYKRTAEDLLQSRKYPFVLLKPGQYLDEKFPMEDEHKLRSAVSYYRRKHKLDLHINFYPKGTKDHPEPHMIVGRRELPAETPV